MGQNASQASPFKSSQQAYYVPNMQSATEPVLSHVFEFLRSTPSTTPGAISSWFVDGWKHRDRKPSKLSNHLPWGNSSECGFLFKDLSSILDWYTPGGGSPVTWEMSAPLGAGGRELSSIFFRKAAWGVPAKTMQGEQDAETKEKYCKVERGEGGLPG